MGAKTPLLKRPWEAKGLACLAGAIVLALCLLSFHPDDPSFTHFVAGDIKTHNLIGAFGSHTADLLVRLLGPGALFLPAALFFCAFRYFRSPSFQLSRVAIGGFILFLMSFAGLLTLAFTRIDYFGKPFKAGGLLGQGLEGTLNTYFNVVGAYILVLLLLVLSLMLTLDLSLAAVGQKIGRTAVCLWKAVRERLSRLQAGDGRPFRGARSSPHHTDTAFPSPDRIPAGVFGWGCIRGGTGPFRLPCRRRRVQPPPTWASGCTDPEGRPGETGGAGGELPDPGEETRRFWRRGQGRGDPSGAGHHHVRARTGPGGQNKQNNQSFR